MAWSWALPGKTLTGKTWAWLLQRRPGKSGVCKFFAAVQDEDGGEWSLPAHGSSSAAKAGDPVRRGLSGQSLRPLEYWVARSSRATTAEGILAARFRPSCRKFVAPLRRRGAGKSRAPTAPAAPCAMGSKNAHGFDRYSQDIPAFPAQWLYGLYVLSPVSGVFCHRCHASTGRHG